MTPARMNKQQIRCEELRHEPSCWTRCSEATTIAKWFLRCPICEEVTEFHETRTSMNALFPKRCLKCQKCGYLKIDKKANK